jgi:DNA-binding beta-propeller fold protein YncE
VIYTLYTQRTTKLLASLPVLAVLAACSSSSQTAGPTDSGSAALPSNLAVTADWLHHTLTLVDFDALIAAGEVGAAPPADGGAQALTAAPGKVGTIDLSSKAQAPYTVKITPDGATAIVTMSAGFFSVPGAGILVNAPSIPTGPGEVLFVDLASRSVVASLETGDSATGIAITHDGKRAFISHAGTTTVTIVDVVAHQKVQDVDIGGTFAEEIGLDDSDTVGIVTYLDPATSQKSVRTFAVADMAMTLSTPIPLGTDAAGVPFFPGTKTAYVALAYNPLTSPNSGYAIIDATQPSSPKMLIETKWTDATYVSYEAIAYPAHGTVLVPLAVGGMLIVREYALGATDLTLQKTYQVAPTALFGAFGAVVDAQGHMVLTMPGDRKLAVLDLASGASYTMPWYSQPGPLGITRR